MGHIEKLEGELYRPERDEQIEQRMQRRVFFPEESGERPPTFWIRSKDRDREASSRKRARLFRRLIIGTALFLVAAGAAFVAIYLLGLRREEAALSIHVRNAVESGEQVTATFQYQNLSKSVLRDAELVILFPAGTLIRTEGIEEPAPVRLSQKIGDIAPKEDGVISVVMRFFGAEGEEKILKAELLYRPEDVGAQFTLGSSENIRIRSVPIGVAWKFPGAVPNGRDVDIELHYASTAHTPFSDLSVVIQPPPEFKIVRTDPEPDETPLVWHIGELKPDTDGTIRLRGAVVGEEGEPYVFRAAIGVYDRSNGTLLRYSESVQEITLTRVPLVIEGSLGGERDAIVRPGARLRFLVRYENNSSATLKNVLIRAFVEESDLVDINSLLIQGSGVFDFETRSIVWGPGSVPALRKVEPSESGTFEFYVETRKHPVVANESDKNRVVRFRTAIEQVETPDVFSGTDLLIDDEIEFKVATVLSVEARSLYHASPVPNEGPIPPKVGAQTSYNVLWELRNFTNDITGAQLRTFLPTNARWMDRVKVPQGTIVYHASSSEVVWDIGTLSAGTGVIRPALVGAFQVAIVPSEIDVGKTLRLTGDMVFAGQDTFIGEEAQRTVPAVTTQLQEDTLTNPGDWKVVR